MCPTNNESDSRVTVSSTLVFYVNGKKVVHENPSPEWTLLYYLRYKLRLCGTKEGCGEGGCGACTVVLCKLNRATGKVLNYAVNACLTPLCSIHGLAVITTEGLGSLRSGLHPIQERIAKSHGTQCGFCTPGFIMSMYALLRNNSKPSEKDMENAFQGNLCRCTGYRPILEGFRTFCNDSNTSSNGSCCMQNKSPATKCCKQINGSNLTEVNEDGTQIKLAETLFDESEFKPYDPSQDPIFPSELKLNSSFDNEELCFVNEKAKWYRPTNYNSLMEFFKDNPGARIVAGNTELGVDAKFKGLKYPVVNVQISGVEELNQIVMTESEVLIGAACTLSELEAHCHKHSKNGNIFSSLGEMLHWFAGQQIRNVATIGGNIATASPIADLNPILIAAEAILHVESSTKQPICIQVNQEFFTAYRKTLLHPDDIIKQIRIPNTKANEFIWTIKQSRRKEDDIAIVNSAMKIEFDDSFQKVRKAILVFGGLGFRTVVASKASKYLVGKEWNKEIINVVFNLIWEEFPLQDDVPGGMAKYRHSLVSGFFLKFYFAVLAWLIEKNQRSPSLIDNEDLSALRACTHNETQGSQLYQIVSENQSVEDLVGRPTAHLSSLKHATGEAEYVDDMPSLTTELFGSLVINRTGIAHGKIMSIDASEALAAPDVVSYFDYKNLDPQMCNKFAILFEEDEEVFASENVHCHGQVIGIVVARTQSAAENAVRLVKVKLEPLSPTILTIEDAIEHNSFTFQRSLKRGKDVEHEFANCDHVIENSMRVGAQEHFYMETQSCLSIPKEDGEMEVYIATQAPHQLRSRVAKVLGVPSNRIKVKSKRCGGAFGGKEQRCWVVGLPSAIAAYKLNAPVRLILNRHEDMESTGFRPSYLFKYQVGFSKEGRIQALDIKYFINSGCTRDVDLAILEITMLSLDGPYFIPNWEINGYNCRTNTPSNTAMRGFGIPEGSVVLHSIIDQVAERVGKNPQEIFQLHLYKKDELSNAGKILEDNTLHRCWNECIKSSNYGVRLNQIREFNHNNHWKKRGIAITATRHNVGFHERFLNQGGALVNVHSDGAVIINHGGTEIGQGIHTKMLAIATRVLEIPISKIYCNDTSTEFVPNAMATCGSMASDLNGMAVLYACQEIKDRLKPYKEANPNGTWEDWVGAAHFDQTNLSAVGFHRMPEAGYSFETNTGEACKYFCFGAACSEVEIDCLTGDHSVLRTDIVMDVGESLNPAIDIGQIEGAFIQGYGMFTMEEILFSPNGQLLSKGPGMYKIPTVNDVPQIFNVSLLRGSSNKRAVYSSKGIGEPPYTLATSVFFAIKNAIKDFRSHNNLSTEFRLDSPATCEKIQLACAGKLDEVIQLSTSKKGWSITV